MTLMQVSEARRANERAERPMSGMKHVRSATEDLCGNGHHFNFMQACNACLLRPLSLALHWHVVDT